MLFQYTVSGDIMKKKLINILKDYKQDFINYLKNLSNKVENNLKDEKKRKIYLFITGFLIIINLLLITSYNSYGYYHSSSEVKLINSRVGNLYLEEYDYIQLIYIEEVGEDGNGLGKYYLADEIPQTGYVFSKYECDNGSTLTYDDEKKVTSVTTIGKECCSIYMDVENE